MYKIYSRRRFIFTDNKNERKYVRKTFKVFLIMLIAFNVFYIAMTSVTPIFNTLCKDRAKSIATIITNEQATKVMKEYSYEELFTIEKDENGNISMIKSNIFPINEIISNIAINIQNEINSTERSNVKIALGSFSGIKLLAGVGPYVNVRISSMGNVETDLRSEFIAQGINQTLHRVFLQVNCQVSILTPFNHQDETISNQILIIENVIVGRIPDTYYNLNGLDSSTGIDLIE